MEERKKIEGEKKRKIEEGKKSCEHIAVASRLRVLCLFPGLS